MTDFNIAIIGAGIAGAGLAAQLAGHKSVLLLEAEAQPGYHSTGRSAAFWDEMYGGPHVQPLTTASGPFLANPPAEFHDGSFLGPRGALYLGRTEESDARFALENEFRDSGVVLHRLNEAAIESHIPGIRSGWTEALWEPSCSDIDVGSLHAAYLKKSKQSGAKLLCNAALKSAVYKQGAWHIDTDGGSFTAAILVNAAGAWADQAAGLSGIKPIGVQPYRRTITQLAIEPAAPSNLPLVIAMDGSFYFKPGAGGRLWLSPHDETETPACDAAPEELDIALAIDRLQQVVDWQVRRVEHSWAGLRSFAPDRLPVIGPDPANPNFFWLAGQGGFGIQTAPAVSQLAGSLLCADIALPGGVDGGLYLPDRLR